MGFVVMVFNWLSNGILNGSALKITFKRFLNFPINITILLIVWPVYCHLETLTGAILILFNTPNR